jgi:glutamate 5-kinase
VIVRIGVVTQVNESDTVCASGAVPPADGKIGCTSNANDAPESAPKITDNPVFGAFVAAVHNASQSDPDAP